MVTPKPCESYAFAGCFIFGGIVMIDLTLVSIDLGKHSFYLHSRSGLTGGDRQTRRQREKRTSSVGHGTTSLL